MATEGRALKYGFLMALALYSLRADIAEAGSGPGPGVVKWQGPTAVNLYFSDQMTNLIVQRLESDFDDCTEIKPNYRYDCYRDVFGKAAGMLNGNQDYRPVQEVFAGVERKIASFVDNNLDPDLPPLRQRGTEYRPIRPEAEPRAREVVYQALDDAQKDLLRSRSVGGHHFVRIADAINSNKVLLRSTMHGPLWTTRLA